MSPQVWRRLLLAVTVVLTLVSIVPAAQVYGARQGSDDLGASEIAPGRVVVKFKPGARQLAEEEIGALGARTVKAKRALEKLGVKVLQVPPGREKEYVEALEKLPEVEFVEPDHRVQVQFTPNDPCFDDQWNLHKVRAPEAWDQGSGTGTVVAVIDTGIDASHPDLASQIVTPTTVLTDTDPADRNGHGTHVAGIVAAAANNGIGVAGMAFGAKVMPIKALSDDGTGYYSDIADAMVLAVDAGAKVLNLSLGGRSPSQLLTEAVNYARAHGSLVFAAAGNMGTRGLFYPAAIPGVVAVGSTSSSDTKSYFSSYGPGLSITAPGEGVLSTLPWPGDDPNCPNGYGTKSGTSMATPLAAGLAALIWSLQPQLTADEVRVVLEGTAVDLGPPGWDEQFGYGRIDAAEAAESLACLNQSTTYYLGPVDAAWSPRLYSWAGSASTAQLYSASGVPNGNLTVSGARIQDFSDWPAGFSGYVKLTTGSCTNPVLLEAAGADAPGVVPPAGAGTEAGLPIRIGSGFGGGLYLINASDADNQVAISVFNTLGQPVHGVSLNLSAREARQLADSDLGLLVPGWAWLRVSSSAPVAAYGYWRRSLGTPVYFPAANSATDQRLPAVRRGVEGWVSQIWLMNPNATPAQVILRFQGGGRTVRRLAATVPPKGFAVADSGRARLPVGWEGTVSVTSDEPIYAFNVMLKSAKRQVGVLGPSVQLRSFHSPSVLKNWYGWTTVFRAFNMNPTATSVSFDVLLDSGSFVIRKQLAPVRPLRSLRYAVAASSSLGNPFFGGAEIFAGLAVQAVAELTNGGRTYFYPLR